jgi:hypothetical protein
MHVSKFTLQLHVVNSGSSNAHGAASECYLKFFSADQTFQQVLLRVGNLAGGNIVGGDIVNGPPDHASFVDVTDPSKPKQIQSVDLPDNDDNLAVLFSIYAGNRTFEQLIATGVGLIVPALTGPLIGNIVGHLASILQDAAKKALNSQQQQWLDAFDKQVSTYTTAIGLGSIGTLSSVGRNIDTITSIKDISNVAGGIVSLPNFISIGDQVANIVLTPA